MDTDRFNRLMAMLILVIILSGIIALSQGEATAAALQLPSHGVGQGQHPGCMYIACEPR